MTKSIISATILVQVLIAYHPQNTAASLSVQLSPQPNYAIYQ